MPGVPAAEVTGLASMTYPAVTRQADSFWCAPKRGTLPGDFLSVALLPPAAQPRLTQAMCHSINPAAPQSGQFLVRTPGKKRSALAASQRDGSRTPQGEGRCAGRAGTHTATSKSGQFLVRTPVCKKLGNPRIPGGMSGVLNLEAGRGESPSVCPPGLWEMRSCLSSERTQTCGNGSAG